MSPDAAQLQTLQPQQFASQRYIGMTEIIRILKRRRFVILTSIGIVMSLALLVLVVMTPQYTASAVLMIQTRNATTESTAQTVVTAPNDELKIASAVELLQAPALIRRVAERLKLVDMTAIDDDGLGSRIFRLLQPPPPAPTTALAREAAQKAKYVAALEDATSKLTAKLIVTRVNKSNLVSISFTSTSPEQAAQVANAMTSEYIAMRTADLRDVDNSQDRRLRAQVEQLRVRVINADRAVAQYRRGNNLVTGSQTQTVQAQLQQLGNQLGTARADRAESSTRYGALQRSLNGGRVDAGTAIANSPLLTDLRSQETLLTKRLAELTAFYGPGQRDVIDTTAQLRDVRVRMSEETRRLVADLRNAAQIASARENQVSGDLGSTRAQAFRENSAAVRLLDLERDAETGRALYVSMLTKLKGLDQQDIDPDAVIASPATTPNAPSHPEPMRTLGASFVAALILATIMAIAAEAMDTKLRTADQIYNLIGAPTLTMVPDVSKKLRSLPPQDILFDEPRSIFAETMRSLNIQLRDRIGNRRSAVVVMTSPLVSDGKTVAAAALAAAAVAMLRTAVVVDMDFHRPDLLRRMGLPGAPADLAAYLRGEANLDEIITRDARHPGLAVIGLAAAAQDPGVMIASPLLPELLDELRSRFDLVVLTTPPLLAVQDARVLSGLADATVLIVRWGRTSPDSARAAAELLDGELTGVVLNQVDYREHARRAHGDAIQHRLRLASYYSSEEASYGSWLARLFGRRWRSEPV